MLWNEQLMMDHAHYKQMVTTFVVLIWDLIITLALLMIGRIPVVRYGRYDMLSSRSMD